MRRRLEAMNLPQVVTPNALLVAMFTIVLAAITEADTWLMGGLIVLVVDALLVRVHDGLRRR